MTGIAETGVFKLSVHQDKDAASRVCNVCGSEELQTFRKTIGPPSHMGVALKLSALIHEIGRPYEFEEAEILMETICKLWDDMKFPEEHCPDYISCLLPSFHKAISLALADLKGRKGCEEPDATWPDLHAKTLKAAGLNASAWFAAASHNSSPSFSDVSTTRERQCVSFAIRRHESASSTHAGERLIACDGCQSINRLFLSYGSVI